MLDLTVCIIAKDEEDQLPRCISSVKSVAGQIVVVDTGSSDRTAAVAAEHGAQVRHFQWNDDFSAARNFALGYVGTKWVLQLDADEELRRGDLAGLPGLLEHPQYNAYSFKIMNLANSENLEGAQGSRAIRLFRTSQFRYQGIIHERPEPRSKRIQQVSAYTGMQIIHWGYIGENDQAKSLRNCRLLEKALESKEDDHMLHYYIGIEYMKLGRYQDAIDALRRAVKLCPTEEHGHRALYALRIGESLAQLGRRAQALRHTEKVLESFSDYPDLLYLAGDLNYQDKNWKRALTWFQRCAKIPEVSPDYMLSREDLDELARQKVADCRSRLKAE